ALPDERAYELVSPPENPGEVYTPQGPHNPEADTGTHVPFRASVDGNAVVYAGDPPVSGGTGSIGEGEGDDFFAVRGPRGWTANDIQPRESHSGGGEGYEGFSDDLSVGFLRAFYRPPSHPLTAD